MQSSPQPCHLVPLRPKCLPQHPILEQPQPTFIPQCQHQVSSQPHKTRGKIMVLRHNRTYRQEIPCFYKTYKVHRHAHISMSLDPVLNQLESVTPPPTRISHTTAFTCYYPLHTQQLRRKFHV